MSKPEAPKLVCVACNHSNEVERVYCHNCGEKLDRSILPKVDELPETDKSGRTAKQVKKMMNPSRMSWIADIKRFILILLFSATVAAVFLVCLAPEGVPPMKSTAIPESEVGDLWRSMMESKLPVSLTFKEFDVNYYLKRALKAGDEVLIFGAVSTGRDPVHKYLHAGDELRSDSYSS